MRSIEIRVVGETDGMNAVISDWIVNVKRRRTVSIVLPSNRHVGRIDYLPLLRRIVRVQCV